MGSRYIPGGAVDERWPFWRKSLSSFGNLYARAILRLPVKDATGGYRMWRRETLVGMPLNQVRSNGYAFQVEMAFIACRLGYTFQRNPILFRGPALGSIQDVFHISRERPPFGYGRCSTSIAA